MYMSMCVHVQPDVFYMDKLSIHVRLGSAQSFKQHNLKVKTVDKLFFFIFTVPISIFICVCAKINHTPTGQICACFRKVNCF